MAEVDSAGEKRARILEAARLVCARAGFDAARMESIAAEARVSKGTLYRFFESKEDLLLASLIDSHLGGSYLKGAGADLAGIEPSKRFEHVIEALVALLPEATRRMPVNMQAWGLVAGDPPGRARLHAALREQVYPLRMAELVESLVDGIEAGAFRRGVDAEVFATTVLAVFDGTLYRSAFDPGHANVDVLRSTFRVLLDSIRASERGARIGAH